MDKIAVGKNVQLLRNAFGYSQAELAEKLGVSTIHMSHIETGRVGMSVDILISICNHLSVTPNDILSGQFDTQSSGNPKVFFENSPYLTENDQILLLDITGLLAKKNQNKEKLLKAKNQTKVKTNRSQSVTKGKQRTKRKSK